jgi:hypothetical protein
VSMRTTTGGLHPPHPVCVLKYTYIFFLIFSFSFFGFSFWYRRRAATLLCLALCRRLLDLQPPHPHPLPRLPGSLLPALLLSFTTRMLAISNLLTLFTT